MCGYIYNILATETLSSGVKRPRCDVTTYFLLPCLRMRGVASPLSNTLSCRGV